MPEKLHWLRSLKAAADNADNTAISCVARSNTVPVSGR